MNREIITREGLVKKPFEARVIDEDLRNRVIFFKKLLSQKRALKVNNKVSKIRSYPIQKH